MLVTLKFSPATLGHKIHLFLNEYIYVLIICILISVTYFWTSTSSFSSAVREDMSSYTSSVLQENHNDYYNLLTNSILNGHLDLGIVPNEELCKYDNPYNPNSRIKLKAGMNAKSEEPYYLYDASLYQGKYYIYFGITPVILLLLPFKLIAGLNIPLTIAMSIFMVLGLVISILILCDINKTYFITSSRFTLYQGIIITGAAQPCLVLLRRTMFYELPYCCAYFLFMVVFYSMYQIICKHKYVNTYTIVATISAGLLVGCRPSFVIYVPVVIILLGYHYYKKNANSILDAKFNKYLTYLIIPIILIGLALAFYNYQRFNKFSEFGQHYQLAGTIDSSTTTPFNPQYIPVNLYNYLLATPKLVNHFPYIIIPDFEPLPSPYKEPNQFPGYTGSSIVLGLFTCFPISLLGFVGPVIFLSDKNKDFKLYLIVLYTFFAAAFILMLFYQGSTLRYLFDFSPGLFLVAAILVMYIDSKYTNDSLFSIKLLFRGLFTLLTIISCVFSLLFSIELYGWFRSGSPLFHAKTSYLLDHLNLFSKHYDLKGSGAIELKIKLKKFNNSNIESLLNIGYSDNAEHVFLIHKDESHYLLGYARGQIPLSPGNQNCKNYSSLQISGPISITNYDDIITVDIMLSSLRKHDDENTKNHIVVNGQEVIELEPTITADSDNMIFVGYDPNSINFGQIIKSEIISAYRLGNYNILKVKVLTTEELKSAANQIAQTLQEKYNQKEKYFNYRVTSYKLESKNGNQATFLFYIKADDTSPTTKLKIMVYFNNSKINYTIINPN